MTIEGVEPEIDGGRFAAKRAVGETFTVRADVFTDGHDIIDGVLLYRRESQRKWREARLTPLGNDRFEAGFVPEELGAHVYTVQGWVDRYATWLHDLRKRVSAEQDLTVPLQIGAGLIEDAAQRAKGDDRRELKHFAKALTTPELEQGSRAETAASDELLRLMALYHDRDSATTYPRELRLWVDCPRAAFSAWYEMFPRSSWDGTGRHATFRDCEKRLDYVARLGFDVLYLPPIHPIGRTFRKGKNNNLVAHDADPGSPWAIGAKEGGHDAIHPELGTEADLKRLAKKASERGIAIALDIALQCSPEHPYVKAHPEWFRWRPDGTIQYAENPPKKYQDIYPIEFESGDWRALWDELRDIFLHWIELGIRIFRIDNPHTKPFRFWEWVIGEIREDHPDVIFLAEAFTRPKVMYHLAKAGFTQSYTYFAWRTTKWDLTQYLEELTKSDVRHYFRPNLWPNTPDILTEHLQHGGPAAFKARLVLAATLSSNYGIYGPAFELMEHRAREHGSEEYLDSEKYEIKTWDVTGRPTLAEFIERVNRVRRENPALHMNDTLQFHEIQNEHLIWYTKHSHAKDNIIAVAVNLDPHMTHAGWAHLPAAALGLEANQPYQVHDLVSDARYVWHGEWNYIELNPYQCPSHIFRIRQHVRTEQDFDYYE